MVHNVSFSMRKLSFEKPYVLFYVPTDIYKPFKMCCLRTPWEVLSSSPPRLASWHHFLQWSFGVDMPQSPMCSLPYFLIHWPIEPLRKYFQVSTMCIAWKEEKHNVEDIILPYGQEFMMKIFEISKKKKRRRRRTVEI